MPKWDGDLQEEDEHVLCWAFKMKYTSVTIDCGELVQVIRTKHHAYTIMKCTAFGLNTILADPTITIVRKVLQTKFRIVVF